MLLSHGFVLEKAYGSDDGVYHGISDSVGLGTGAYGSLLDAADDVLELVSNGFTKDGV